MTAPVPSPDPRARLAALPDVVAALMAVLDAAEGGVVFQDADGRIKAANRRAEEILGLSSEELAGTTSTDRDVFTIHRDGSRFEGADHPSMVALRTREPVRGVPMGVYEPGGALHWIAINAQPVVATDGELLGVVTSFIDHTDRLETESHVSELMDRLARQALIDPLTDLPNRRAFDARLAEEVARSRRHGAPLSLAVIDVDAFKVLNDTRGHPAGDLALSRLAETLRATVRQEDVAVRLAGDEFAVILPGVGLAAASAALDRIRQGVATDAALVEMGVTISAGLAERGPRGTGSDLYRRADAALYRAKASGGNRAAVDR